MTLVVLGIVLAHAVPVFIVSVLTKSKIFLTIAAIIFGVIGVEFGNPAYTFADLIGVGIAYFLGISFINGTKPVTSLPANPPPPQSTLPAAKDSDLHFLHVVGLCAVGGWMLALDMGRQSGRGYNNISFFELLFDPGFIGMAAAPAFALCAAAALGWIVGKLIKPVQPYASWVALALAGGLFLALKTGAEIGDRRASMPSDSPTSQAVPWPVPMQKPIPASPKNVTPRPTFQPSVAVRLQTLAYELNGGVPKAFGDHLTLINASVNGNSLYISLRINNYTAADTEAQIPLENFNSGITRYYCGSESYGLLLNQGATFVVQLYGKDSGSIGAYPITIISCKK